jgi:electron transfer flavoprotein beta subunit
VARELAAVAHDHDLVLLGNDAADSGDFQVGIRLAYELGRPVVNGVSTVEVEDGVLVARGEGPDGHETFRLPPPAVVTILEGGVEPRYPSVPGRMKAKKVAIDERQLTAEPAGPQRVGYSLPPPVSSDVQILGEGAAAAPAVVDLFERIGVISR